MKITECGNRKIVVQFDYNDLIEQGLERFIRTGTLYGKGACSVIEEYPFYFAAATEYLKENDRYIKHAGFPVVVQTEKGPSVLIPLYIASPLYDRRNVWAAEKAIDNIPVGERKEEIVNKVKNALVNQYYETEAIKAIIEDALSSLNKASSALKVEALEKIEKEEQTPINVNLEITTELLQKILNELMTTGRKYDRILLKIFKRVSGGKVVESTNWEKAFNLLADNWKLTEKVRKQFVDQAKDSKEIAEKVSTVVQPKLVERKSMKMASVISQIFEGIVGWFKNLISNGRRFLSRLIGLNEGLDVVESLIE